MINLLEAGLHRESDLGTKQILDISSFLNELKVTLNDLKSMQYLRFVTGIRMGLEGSFCTFSNIMEPHTHLCSALAAQGTIRRGQRKVRL